MNHQDAKNTAWFTARHRKLMGHGWTRMELAHLICLCVSARRQVRQNRSV